ncbi:MAG: hypothetical protein U0637_03175 [Phycisphaerales bacterium]
MRPLALLCTTMLCVAAHADIVVTRQAASVIASGGEGTVQQFGPEDAPWSFTGTSGQSPGCRGEAALTTQWDPSAIHLLTSAAITPGSPLVLTQALTQVDIEFDLTDAGTMEVRYDVVDQISQPPPPYVFTTTRLVDLTTINELHTTPGLYTYTLPAGPFRLEVQNILGNFENDPAFAHSARTISVTLRLLPPCDTDFNNDQLFPDTQDIRDMLSVFAGAPCPTPPPAECDSIDFNHDGIFPDTQDIQDFLTAFAGGAC